MPEAHSQVHCPEGPLAQAVETTKADPERGLGAVEQLLVTYPQDPRLHFLKGSILAGLRHYDEARPAMQRAVDLAPEFWIARFQLGFFELTCGEAATAQQTWAPLDKLPPGDPLRLFSQGLTELVRGDYARCTALLEQGMAANRENPPLNGDMRLIVQALQELGDEEGRPEEAGTPEPQSTSEHLLLRQYTSRVRH